MAQLAMVGGGIVGLFAALLLARDGHDVTVLERDPAEPPEPQAAWDRWERKGVNQFRMLHGLQPRFRELAEANAPEVAQALTDSGALRTNPFRYVPESITGGFRESDARYDALTARRPVAEAAIAGVVRAADGVDVRRGVVVRGLLADGSIGGVPHVVGVRTDEGDDVHADVVIDAAGRRSALPGWLVDIGARAPIEENEDCGFVYYGRHFRSDGSTPPPTGGLLASCGAISVLMFPADNNTWGISVITSAKDAPMRALKDLATWTRVVGSLPLVADWIHGEPLDDKIAVMAKIEDRHRSFAVDGDPVATGVLALGDSWACTNPSVGRGISMGAIHAVALRDLFRDPSSDPVELARSWDAATMATVEPWYRATLAFDRARLDQIDALIEGREFEPSPDYAIMLAMQSALPRDPEILRAFLEIMGVLELPEDVLARPGLADRVIEVGGHWRDDPPLGPERAELLALVAG